MPLFGLFGPPDVEKLEAKRDVEGLIKALSYKKDSEVRWMAAVALGQFGRVSGVVWALEKALNDVDPLVREMAVEALGQIGMAAKGSLIVALLNTEASVRQTAMKRMVQFGPAIVDDLVDRIRPAQKEAPEWIAQVLVKIGADAVRPLFIRVFWKKVALEAAQQIVVRIGIPAIKPLVQMMKSNQTVSDYKELLISTCEMVKTGLNEDAVEPLIKMLQDPDVDVQRAAAQLLGELKDARAVKPLVAALKGNAAIPAAYALAELEGQRAVDPIITMLNHPNELVRFNAARLLGELGDGRAVEALINALSDTDTMVRQTAVTALGRLGDRQALEPIEKLLNDEDVKEQAIMALVNLGDERAIEMLTERLENGDAETRRKMLWASSDALDSRVVRPLIKLIKTDHYTAKSAVSALKEILERVAAKLTLEDLQEIADLPATVVLEYISTGGCDIGTRKEDRVDCSLVKQLARQELIRRGEQA